MERTAKPTAENHRCPARRNPQEAQASQQAGNPQGLEQAVVTPGWWSGAAAPFAPATPNATERAVKALTAVVALTVRMAFFARGGKIRQSILNITTHYAPDLPEWQGVRA